MSRPDAPTDRAWRGYHPRAAVPHVLLAAAASAALLAGRWYFDDLSWLAARTGALVVYAVVLVGWAGVVAVLAYRAVTYTYRLTDRALFIDRGWCFRPEPPVWLSELKTATAGTTWAGRRTGVGRVWVTAAGGRVVRLAGIRDPGGFAAAIAAAAGRARAEGVGPPAG